RHYVHVSYVFSFYNPTPTALCYTLSLHDALPISLCHRSLIYLNSFPHSLHLYIGNSNPSDKTQYSLDSISFPPQCLHAFFKTTPSLPSTLPRQLVRLLRKLSSKVNGQLDYLCVWLVTEVFEVWRKPAFLRVRQVDLSDVSDHDYFRRIVYPR